jgi:hypothetical protein
MPDIEAFEAVVVNHTPAVTWYQGQTYSSDQTYTDADGSTWGYVGTYNGSSMWFRSGDAAAWNITAVVDQFGPLTEGGA